MTVAAKSVNCKHEPGVFVPVINRDKCEGKAESAAV